jgi:repressor LexA
MRVGDRIKKRRTELEMSVDELAAKLQKNRATVYRYESGEIENLPLSILEPVAEALHTSPAYLMGWEADAEPRDDYTHIANIFPIETRKIPLLGEIACGEPIFADERFEHYVECGADIRADFALKCNMSTPYLEIIG